MCKVEFGFPTGTSGELAHGAGDVHDQEYPCSLALLSPEVEHLGEHLGLGHLKRRLGFVGVNPVGGDDGGPHRYCGVAGSEPEREHLALVVGELHVVAEGLGRQLVFRGDPVSVEHDEWIVAEQGALLGVNGHQGDAWLLGRLAR